MPSDLFHRMMDSTNLWAAWARVRQGGKAAGLDGMRVEQFDFHAEREMARLRRDLRAGTYRPWPARRVRLPKSDGGVRLIGIQAIRDRVVQRALMNLIQPRIEPLLEDCSFAFRPRRSIESALSRLDSWHQRGYEWVARSDIQLCFDSLDRTLLLDSIRAIIPEEDVLALIHLWLTAGVIDEENWQEPGVGVMQGDVLSPLLCNLYLDAFDEAVLKCNHPLIRYADDIVLLGRSEAEARGALLAARTALTELHLETNSHKEWIGTFIQGFEYLGAAIVGDLMLPTHRVETPGRPPRFTFGYERVTPHMFGKSVFLGATPFFPPLAATRSALRDRMVSLLRAERAGRTLPMVGAALLHAWQAKELLPMHSSEPDVEPWQSVYMI